MTRGAVLCDVESRVAIVAGAAGFTLPHLLHTHLVAVGFGHEDVRMAFVAAEHVEMRGMRERDHANAIGLNGDLVRDTAVAVGAVLCDAKSCVAIVTCAAGFTCLHLGHADLVAVGFGLEGPGMAFVTTEHAEMGGMRKINGANITLHDDLIRGAAVTGGAIFGDVESRVAIMTCATGLTLPHLGHADLVAVGFGLEDLRVAFVAAELLGMDSVGKKDFADNTLDRHIFGTCMAVAAVAFDAERCIAIMTGTA